jgi:uncharacterized protein (TIGR00369 family)
MAKLTPLEHINAFGVRIPFVEHLGFDLKFYENGESEMHFEPQAEHLNSFNVAHGGSIMTLLDVSMATAARSIDKQCGVVTIEMKTSFMRPCTGLLIARGKLLHQTRSMAFTQSTIYNTESEICAQATGTFKYVPGRTPASVSTD